MNCITLNCENSKFFNFKTLRDMILEITPPVHKNNPWKLKRKPCGEVVSVPEKKEYKVVLKKRRLMENFDTLPYGY